MTDQQRRVPWARSGLHPVVVRSLERATLDESVLVTLHSDSEAEVTHLGGSHPADWLTGVLAPIECVGLVVLAPGVVRGRGRRSLAVGSTALPSNPGERVVVAQEVRTNGSARFWVGAQDGLTSLARQGGSGLVPDAMRRAMQLDTAPPDQPVGWFWLAMWLADAFALTPGAGARDLARWHPAIDPREVDHVPDSGLREFVVQRHVDHGRAVDWSAVRATAIDGALDFGHLPAPVAAWHDDGSFSRALSDQLPPITELCHAAGALLAPSGFRLIASVAAAIRGTVDGTGRSTISSP